MSAQLSALGRELPLGLCLCPPGEDSLRLLVAYRDGLEVYSGSLDGLFSKAQTEQGVEVFKLIERPEGLRVLLGGASLTVLDENLIVLASVPAPEEEPIRSLLPLVKGGFLSYSDDESVRHWVWDDKGLPLVDIAWPISCLPLFARPNGKSVVGLENGRLCERDPADGRMVKSWPKSPTLVSAFADANGHCLVTIDEDGQGQLWDMHSREALFAFNTPVRLHHGVFAATGATGVLLTSDGDLLSFKTADGGGVKPLPVLGQPAVDVVCGPDGTILALDENGGVWSVDNAPRQIGGSWAGWATGGLALADGRVVVGTASGELLLYPQEGAPTVQRAHQDAVLALFEVDSHVISVSADGQVFSTPLGEFGNDRQRVVGDFAGESVVGCHMESGGQRLWLALEEGRVAWLDPHDGGNQGEYQLSEHRIEELRPGARPGEILILTDRGSLKRLRV